MQLGKSQQFSAAVSGTGNTSVNWLVNGVLGGNTAVGKVSDSGVYTAPASMPTGSPVTVSAESVPYPSAEANAILTLTSSPTSVTVSISPPSASIQTNQSQQFTASVSGISTTTVNWLVAGIPGGNSSVGTISSNGFYTAPSIAPSSPISVTAQSTYNPASSATSTVTILATAQYVDLSWIPSTSSVIGYNVYRSSQASSPFTRLNSTPQSITTYTDNNVQSGQTYYYVTTAVDSNGAESGYSNVAHVVMP